MSKWNKFSANIIMSMAKKDTSNIPANATLCQIHRLCEYDTCVQKIDFTDTDVTITLIFNMLTHKCTPPTNASLFNTSDNKWSFGFFTKDDLLEIPIEHSYTSGKFYTTTFTLPKHEHDNITKVKMDYNKYNSDGPANYLIFDWIKRQVYFECNYSMLATKFPDHLTYLAPNNSLIKDIIFANIKERMTWFSNSQLVWEFNDPKIYNVITKVVYVKDNKLITNQISDNQISVNDVKETDILEIDI